MRPKREVRLIAWARWCLGVSCCVCILVRVLLDVLRGAPLPVAAGACMGTIQRKNCLSLAAVDQSGSISGFGTPPQTLLGEAHAKHGVVMATNAFTVPAGGVVG